MTARRALVTGASGFVGSHVAEALLVSGWQVRALVRTRSSRRWLEKLDVEYAIADLAGDEGLVDACNDCTCVVHAAALTNAVTPRDYDAINRAGTRRLRDAAVRAGVARIVLVSSLAARGPRPLAQQPGATESHQAGAARGDRSNGAGGPQDDASSAGDEASHPINAYGRSKLAAERLLLETADAMASVIVRAPAVYGPRDTDVLRLVRMVLAGWFPLVAGGRHRLSLVHAADLAAGIRLACEHPDARGRYTLTDGVAHDHAEWGRALARAAGVHVRMIPVPIAMLTLAAWGGEAWGRLTGRVTALNVGRLSQLLGADWTANDARARAELGYAPAYDLDRGLAETVAWYQRAGWI